MSPFQPLLATTMRRRSKYIYLARSTFWFDSVQSQVLKMTQKDGIQIRYINFLWTWLRRKIKIQSYPSKCSNILRKSTPFFFYPSTHGTWAPIGSENMQNLVSGGISKDFDNFVCFGALGEGPSNERMLDGCKSSHVQLLCTTNRLNFTMETKDCYPRKFLGRRLAPFSPDSFFLKPLGLLFYFIFF